MPNFRSPYPGTINAPSPQAYGPYDLGILPYLQPLIQSVSESLARQEERRQAARAAKAKEAKAAEEFRTRYGGYEDVPVMGPPPGLMPGATLEVPGQQPQPIANVPTGAMMQRRVPGISEIVAGQQSESRERIAAQQADIARYRADKAAESAAARNAMLAQAQQLRAQGKSSAEDFKALTSALSMQRAGTEFLEPADTAQAVSNAASLTESPEDDRKIAELASASDDELEAVASGMVGGYGTIPLFYARVLLSQRRKVQAK